MVKLRKKLPSANALFVFEAAARCGNFTRAAQELEVSQPAVSRMLSRMEDHLGVQLFERVRGGIELTDNGRILYREIAEGFTGIENAISEIESRGTGAEPVTLAVSGAFITHWLIPRMKRLTQAFPDLDVRYRVITAHVADAPADLSLRLLAENGSATNSALIMPETLVPVCSRAYPDANVAEGDTLIVTSEAGRGWHERFSAFAARERQVTHTLAIDDYASAVQSALLGQGIAPGRLTVVSHWLLDGALRAAVEEVAVTDRRCCLIWPEHRPLQPAAADLRDWIVEEMRTDLRALDRRYAALQLRRALAAAGFRIG